MSAKPLEGDKSTDEKRKKRRRRRAGLLVSSLYIIALAVAFLYVVPALFFHGDRYIPLIESYLSDALGAEVSIGSIHIGLIPDARIVLDNLMIRKEGRPLLSIRRAKAGVYLTESVKTRSVMLDDLALTKPAGIIERGEDGAFNLPFLNALAAAEGRPVEGAEQAMEIAPAGVFAAFKKVVITDGAVYWTDRMISPQSPFRANLTRFNLSLVKERFLGPSSMDMSFGIASPGGEASFELSGDFSPVGEDVKDIAFSGGFEMKDLHTSRFWPYIRFYTPFEKLDAVATMSGVFDGSVSGGFESKGELLLRSIGIRYEEAFSRELRERRASLSYDLAGREDTITLRRADFSMGPVSLAASGRIMQAGAANPSMSIDVSLGKISVENLLEFVPDRAFTPQIYGFLRKNVRWGNIALENFRYEGDFEKLKNPSPSETLAAFSGTLRVTDMSLDFEGLAFPLDDVNGSVTLKNNAVILSGVTAGYGSSVLEEISGSVRNIQEWPKFRVYVKAGLDLMEARDIIAQRAASAEFRRQIEMVRWLQGAVLLDLEVKGDTRDLASTLAMNGKMKLKDVGLETSVFDLPIYDLDGDVEGDARDIVVRNLSWKAGGSSFTLSGELKNALGGAPEFDLKLISTVSLADMNKIKFLSYGKMYEQSGIALLELGVKGSFTDFDLDYRLDMSNSYYRLGNLLRKPEGLKNLYLFTGSVRGGEQIRIRGMTVWLGESRVDISGRIGRFIRGEGVELTLSTDGLLLDDLDRVLKNFDDIESGGYVAGKLSITDDGEDIPVRLSGTLLIENATFKLPIFRGVFADCDGSVELVNNRIFLKDGRGKFGGGQFALNGSGALRREAPEFNLNVEAESLNLTDFFKKREKKEEDEEEAPKDTKRSYLDGAWNIVVKSKAGTIGMLKYQQLNTVIKYGNRRFHIEPMTFSAHGGRWSWKGDVTLMEDKRIGVDSYLMVQDMKMDRFLEEALGAKKTISGPLNIRGPIRGAGVGLGGIVRGLEGEIEASAGAGTIHKFNLLAKIFSLINVTGYLKLRTPDLADGMPFNSITAKFRIKNGAGTTDDLYVDSDAMRIMAVGDYDIADKKIAMTIGVMPLPTWDKVISSIPLVGEVLTGKEKSLLASYYEVTGSIADPEVRPVPIESLAAGIAGILKRLIELPVTTIRKLENVLQPKPGPDKNGGKP